MSIESIFTRSWYGRYGWTNIFWPIQPFIRHVVESKRTFFLEESEASFKASVPVIIVGNINVGGTGKSPMVVALCQLLIKEGYRPGIVSRGHGVKIKDPVNVQPDSLASIVGDEPVMLARRTNCPLVVFPKRAAAVKHLLATTDVNIVISDDGMQHYHLDRDIEIAMLDAKRGLGNGQLLPVGPLREPAERLKEVDFVVSISDKMTKPLEALSLPITLVSLDSTHLVSLDGTRTLSYDDAFLEQKKWHVIAGIGNPQRFLDTLETLGLQKENIRHRWFKDHHLFDASDIPSNDRVIMTEKDAVKCQSLIISNKDVWYLPVSMVLSESFQHAFLEKINLIKMDDSHE